MGHPFEKPGIRPVFGGDLEGDEQASLPECGGKSCGPPEDGENYADALGISTSILSVESWAGGRTISPAPAEKYGLFCQLCWHVVDATKLAHLSTTIFCHIVSPLPPAAEGMIRLKSLSGKEDGPASELPAPTWSIGISLDT